MKEFNLKEAKRGAKLCTRDGRQARIICWDAKSYGEKHIVALVQCKTLYDFPRSGENEYLVITL